MTAIFDQYRGAIVQIATPYRFGTGFYLTQYDVIITNEHIVRDSTKVVVIGQDMEKQLVRVLFWDARLDLAFLESPKKRKFPEIELGFETGELGEKIWAMGYSFDNEFSMAEGEITNLNYQQEDTTLWQHNAKLAPESSGGPLFNKKGKIIAINTFLLRDGTHFGYALSATHLKKSLEKFQEAGRLASSNCYHCNFLVTEKNVKKNRCPNCNQPIILPSFVKPYEPFGIPKTIENIIEATGHDVELSRRGPNNWAINQGSATIEIAYYEKQGLITGDAYLCNLPKENGIATNEELSKIYQYLLEQNYEIEGLNFSVKNDDVVLSLLIYDRYLNTNTGTKLFQHLFERADHYDNILVEKYSGKWRMQSK